MSEPHKPVTLQESSRLLLAHLADEDRERLEWLFRHCDVYHISSGNALYAIADVDDAMRIEREQMQREAAQNYFHNQ